MIFLPLLIADVILILVYRFLILDDEIEKEIEEENKNKRRPVL